MIAINRIRPQPHYRRDAFDAGLRKVGYTLPDRGQPKSRKDLLIVWNRHGDSEREADLWERDGGTVLVAENGYIGTDKEGRQLYAMALDGHNGSGRFPIGSEDRFSALGIELEAWRGGAGYLVCGQRGIGSRSMRSPEGFAHRTHSMLKKQGVWSRVRNHPGRHAPEVTLEQDLTSMAACVIWSSSSGVRALAMGIPVVYCAPRWICEEAASRIGEPLKRDERARVRAMHIMSHAQWTVAEIESGEPFARLMQG